MPTVVERLAAAGLVQESAGAQVVFPPGFTNREGEPLPLIVRSSAGAFTYATSDLACVVDRVERVKAETLLYVVGCPAGPAPGDGVRRQHDGRVVAAACRSRAHPVRQRARQGRQDAAQPQRRSGRPRRGRRRGDRAWNRRRRREEPRAARRTAQLDRPRRGGRGVEVRRPVDRSRARLRLRLGPHAVVRRQHGALSAVRPHADLLAVPPGRSGSRTTLGRAAVVVAAPEERALALRLLGYEAALGEAVGRYSPHRLCTYLFELATDFTAFYEHCPVLKAPSGRVAGEPPGR